MEIEIEGDKELKILLKGMIEKSGFQFWLNMTTIVLE